MRPTLLPKGYNFFHPLPPSSGRVRGTERTGQHVSPPARYLPQTFITEHLDQQTHSPLYVHRIFFFTIHTDYWINTGAYDVSLDDGRVRPENASPRGDISEGGWCTTYSAGPTTVHGAVLSCMKLHHSAVKISFSQVRPAMLIVM